MQEDAAGRPLCVKIVLTHPCSVWSLYLPDGTFALNWSTFGETLRALEPYWLAYADIGTHAFAAYSTATAMSALLIDIVRPVKLKAT